MFFDCIYGTLMKILWLSEMIFLLWTYEQAFLQIQAFQAAIATVD